MGSQAGVVDINHTSTTNFVCGLSFSRSQPDFEGFFRALRFPPSSKSTPSLIHLAVVLCSEIIHGSCSGAEHLAGSTVPFDPTSLSCALRNSVSDCEEGRLAGRILGQISSIKESSLFTVYYIKETNHAKKHSIVMQGEAAHDIVGQPKGRAEEIQFILVFDGVHILRERCFHRIC